MSEDGAHIKERDIIAKKDVTQRREEAATEEEDLARQVRVCQFRGDKAYHKSRTRILGQD